MKLSPQLKAEREYVKRRLADDVICERCGATLNTFSDACRADLAELCPGYIVIENAKAVFKASLAAIRAAGKEKE